MTEYVFSMYEASSFNHMDHMDFSFSFFECVCFVLFCFFKIGFLTVLELAL